MVVIISMTAKEAKAVCMVIISYSALDKEWVSKKWVVNT